MHYFPLFPIKDLSMLSRLAQVTIFAPPWRLASSVSGLELNQARNQSLQAILVLKVGWGSFACCWFWQHRWGPKPIRHHHPTLIFILVPLQESSASLTLDAVCSNPWASAASTPETVLYQPVRMNIHVTPKDEAIRKKAFTTTVMREVRATENTNLWAFKS